MSRVTDQIQLPRVMTVQEIEAACREYHPAHLRPLLQRLSGSFPGSHVFSTRLSHACPHQLRGGLRQCGMKWGAFTQEFDTRSRWRLTSHVHEIESPGMPTGARVPSHGKHAVDHSRCRQRLRGAFSLGKD